MKNNLSSTGILKDISSMRQFAIKLLGRGKDYDELLSVIIKKDYYYDDDLRILKIKDLQLALNKSYSVISRQLQEIYKDLQEHYKLGIEFTIKKVEYIFYMYYFDRYSWFILDELPFMPRIGECIEIPFLREKVGCSVSMR